MSQETFGWHCPTCEKSAAVGVVASWDVFPANGEEFDPHRWKMCKCLECAAGLVFIEEPTWSGWDRDDWGKTLVYPETSRSLPLSVPKRIRDSFDEANRCMSVRAFNGAALLARRAVEALCDELGAGGRTLNEKLEDSKASGLLNDQLFNWSTVVRRVGNAGAHETSKQMSREDAVDGLKFLEALIDYHYVFQARYQDFVERQTK